MITTTLSSMRPVSVVGIIDVINTSASTPLFTVVRRVMMSPMVVLTGIASATHGATI